MLGGVYEGSMHAVCQWQSSARQNNMVMVMVAEHTEELQHWACLNPVWYIVVRELPYSMKAGVWRWHNIAHRAHILLLESAGLGVHGAGCIEAPFWHKLDRIHLLH